MRRGRGNRSLPDMRTRLQCFLALARKGVLFVLLAASASALLGCPARGEKPDKPPLAKQRVEHTEEEVMALLEERWSARDTPGIIALFAPSRRELASENANIIQAKIATYSPHEGDQGRSWRLDHRCHGRGEQMLIARIDLSPRESLMTRPHTADRAHAPITETLWLVFEQGSWWLYSL